MPSCTLCLFPGLPAIAAPGASAASAERLPLGPPGIFAWAGRAAGQSQAEFEALPAARACAAVTGCRGPPIGNPALGCWLWLVPYSQSAAHTAGLGGVSQAGAHPKPGAVCLSIAAALLDSSGPGCCLPAARAAAAAVFRLLRCARPAPAAARQALPATLLCRAAAESDTAGLKHMGEPCARHGLPPI